MKNKIILLFIFVFFVLGDLVGKTTEDYFKKGRDYYKKGKFEISLVTLLRSVKRNPENPSTYLYIGNIYALKRDFAKAIAFYKIGMDLTKSPVVFYFNMGKAYFFKADYANAAKFMSKAMIKKDKLPQFHLEMGRIFYRLTDKTNTIKQWEHFLVAAPNDPQANNIRRAIAFLKRKDFLFPSDKKKLADEKRKKDEERKRILRERLLKILNQNKNNGTGTGKSGNNSSGTNSNKINNDKIGSGEKDVKTTTKDKKDYNKTEDIEKD